MPLKKLVLVILFFPLGVSAETVDRRVSRLEQILTVAQDKFDGVVPERTIVYKTTHDCQEVKKTKMYFDAIHPFKTIAKMNCANQVFLVVRWYDKEGSNEININTVLQDDVILAAKE